MESREKSYGRQNISRRENGITETKQEKKKMSKEGKKKESGRKREGQKGNRKK